MKNQTLISSLHSSVNYSIVMRALSRKEAAGWCRERGISFNPQGDPGYGLPPVRRLDIKLPTTTAALIYAARMLTLLESRGFYASAKKSESEFDGCLVWVLDHTTWSTMSQDVGLYAFTQLCAPATRTTEPQELDKNPIYVFDEGEVIHATAALLQPLLFQWDALVIPASGNYIARLCHDGNIRGIIARTPEMLDHVKPLFTEFGVQEGIPRAQPRIKRPG